MAATRLIAMHINKGKTLAQCIKARTDYSMNPDKTDDGNYISSYECDPVTVDEEFLLTKREYLQKVGRKQKNDIIAYQIRQSFKPGEITPEEANKIGYELGMRFTKGKHAFMVCTHTDKPHIHNHIIFNSTRLDATKKFKNFWFSGLAIQRLSDIICLENGLSVIELKPYSMRTKLTEFPKRDSFRSNICNQIDIAISKNPKDFDEFLSLMAKAGFEYKRGKHISFRGKGQQRFIRLRSLEDGYKEDDIRKRIHVKCTKAHKELKLNLLINIQEKIINKGEAYERWATNFNLKQISKTLLFLRDHEITSIEDLNRRVDSSIDHFNQLSDDIKAKEKRIAEIQVLKKHIFNYSDTRDIYVEYRKSGYSKKYLEAHREQILIHKAAKDAFNDLVCKKIPKVKELNEEYLQLLSEKKNLSSEYYKARSLMQEYKKAQKNVEEFLREDSKYDKEKNKVHR